MIALEHLHLEKISLGHKTLKFTFKHLNLHNLFYNCSSVYNRLGHLYSLIQTVTYNEQYPLN